MGITTTRGKNINLSPLHLEQGRPAKVEVLYDRTGQGKPEANSYGLA